MPSRSPIPLFPQPPFSPQGGPPSDESDFPPIRIREDVSMSETHPHPILTPDLSDRLTMNWLQITCLLVNMWAPQTNPRSSPVALFSLHWAGWSTIRGIGFPSYPDPWRCEYAWNSSTSHSHSRFVGQVNHESALRSLPVSEHVSIQTNPRPWSCSHSVGQVDLPSDDLDFLPIHEHASTPDPPRCSWLPKKGLGRKNILNNIHTDAQQSKVRYQDLSIGDYTNQYTLKALKRKCSEFTQERLPKRQRLAFDKTDMDWLKGELHDIKFEIGEIRTSMMGIADCLRNEEDFRLEHILYPIWATCVAVTYVTYSRFVILILLLLIINPRNSKHNYLEVFGRCRYWASLSETATLLIRAHNSYLNIYALPYCSTCPDTVCRDGPGW